ncbi:DNA-binding transcriptional LysR family regulator [Cupriavidus agavae]|uniref:DNA-binding transcriptional LysR family regulator n=2 Tax=Cupriavidus agavae TaxID=1001822 RepID=A0A4Q7S7X1_9BURK|nr:DNA-binding transcriptional LysR family regulator [Cupriavidus agavae]
MSAPQPKASRRKMQGIESAFPAAKEITLRQMRYFRAAAATGQFSMAATEEHVSQSAITNAVLALEQLLGVRLFDRFPHGVALTAEGNHLYQHVTRILESVEDALRQPRIRLDALEGSVSIAATYTVLGYFLPGLLARFRNNYPNVELDLHDLDRLSVEEQVLRGDIELGIVLLSNVEEPTRFGHRPLIRSRRQLWAAPGHPLLQGPPPTLRQIAEYPYILLTVDEGEASTMRYWQSKRIAPNVGFRTTSMEALRGLVAHGFGVTVLSDMVFRPWSLEGKEIEARPLATPAPDMEVGVIWRKDTELSVPATALRDFLIYACSR